MFHISQAIQQFNKLQLTSQLGWACENFRCRCYSQNICHAVPVRVILIYFTLDTTVLYSFFLRLSYHLLTPVRAAGTAKYCDPENWDSVRCE